MKITFQLGIPQLIAVNINDRFRCYVSGHRTIQLKLFFVVVVVIVVNDMHNNTEALIQFAVVNRRLGRFFPSRSFGSIPSRELSARIPALTLTLSHLPPYTGMSSVNQLTKCAYAVNRNIKLVVVFGVNKSACTKHMNITAIRLRFFSLSTLVVTNSIIII